MGGCGWAWCGLHNLSSSFHAPLVPLISPPSATHHMHLIYFTPHSYTLGTLPALHRCGYVTQEEACPPIDLHTSSVGWLRHIQEVQNQKQDDRGIFWFVVFFFLSVLPKPILITCHRGVVSWCNTMFNLVITTNKILAGREQKQICFPYKNCGEKGRGGGDGNIQTA